jgi:two-component system response regulator HydG
MARLRSYDWPGNVRELENTLERAVLFAQDPEISEIDLEVDPALPMECGWKAIRKQVLDDLEGQYLEQALRRFQGNVGQVAEWMELTPRAVYLKLNEFGIHPSLFRPQPSRNGNGK